MSDDRNTALTRVIVDECVGFESALIQRFKATFAEIRTSKPPVEFIHLAERHRGIPDVELLRQILGPKTILLTNDRRLHNQACELGLRSYTLDGQGNLRRKKLPDVSTTKPVLLAGGRELKSDYVHPANPLASALKKGMSDKTFRKYRTRRRRIRSYFGAETNIAGAALTIGAAATTKGWLCGYVIYLAAKSGVKGLHASEGYCVSAAAEAKPAWCLIHALREVYLLQLESIPSQLYIIPPASLTLCQQLLEPPDSTPTTADTQSVQRLLRGLATVQVFSCVKGRFFERMERKLAQLARKRSNELVPVAFDQIEQQVTGIPQ